MEIVTGEVKVEVPISKVKLDRSSVIASVCILYKKNNWRGEGEGRGRGGERKRRAGVWERRREGVKKGEVGEKVLKSVFDYDLVIPFARNNEYFLSHKVGLRKQVRKKAA